MQSSDLVRNHVFVAGLAPAQIDCLAAIAVEMTFDEDEVILESGERSKAFYLIVAGSVAIELQTAGFTVCIQSVGPNEVFGWSALLDHQDTLFRVRAREHTLAVRLEGEALATTFEADPPLGVEFLRRTLRVVAGRVRATERRFAEMCGVKI